MLVDQNSLVSGVNVTTEVAIVEEIVVGFVVAGFLWSFVGRNSINCIFEVDLPNKFAAVQK